MATKLCVVSLPIILVLTLNISYAFGVDDKLTINLGGKSSSATTFTSYLILTDQPKNFVLNVPKSAFFVVQVHTYLDEVILSNNANFTFHSRAKGQNIGLVQIVDKRTSYDFYLQHNLFQNTTALLAVTIYDKDAPIPGGCNLTFDVENAPYQLISYNEDVITVDVQSPSIGDDFCEGDFVELEIYRYFLGNSFDEQAYFETLKNLLDVDFIVKYAEKVPSPLYTSNLRRHYVNYQGVGSIYLAVATHKNSSSAYVPALSYGCNFAEGPTSCFQHGPNYYVLPLHYIVGGILVTAQSFTNFVLIGLTYYIILIPITITWQVLINGLISLFILMLLINFSLREHVNYLIASYVLTCDIFFSSIGDLYIYQNVYSYWSFFLLMNIILVLITRSLPDRDFTNSSFLASFYVYTGICCYVSSGPTVNLFVVNLKHLTVPHFSYAVVQNPEVDLIAFILMFVVLTIGYIKRRYCETSSVYFVEIREEPTEESPLLP